MELDDARAPVELLVVEELGHELLLGEDEREGSRGGRAQAWMCEGTGGLGRELLLHPTERRTSRDEAGGVALVAGFAGGVEETKASRAR